MIIVKVKDKGGINRALKEYKSKVIKTKQMQELKDRQEFEKPSSKKRRMKQKAKYKNNLNRDV